MQSTEPSSDARRFPAARHVLVWLLPLALLVQALFLAPERSLSHDEHITLLAITGHQLSYEAPTLGHLFPLEEVQQWQTPGGDGGLGSMLLGLRETDVHPPLYFLAARGWLRLAPRHEPRGVDRWLRALSALFVALGCWLAAREARCSEQTGEKQAGLWGIAALLALGSYSLAQAGSARPYALILLLATASLLTAQRLIRRQVAPLRTTISLGLLIGDYYVSIGIWPDEYRSLTTGEPYDHRPSACILRIGAGREKGAGVAGFPCDWTVERTGAPTSLELVEEDIG